MKNFYKKLIRSLFIFASSGLFVQNALSLELQIPDPLTAGEWQATGLTNCVSGTPDGVASNGIALSTSPNFISPQFSPLAMSASITGPVTPSVGLSSGIAELAAALGNDPVVLSKWVHDHVDYVPYYGVMQGAEVTLLTRSGNDADQAALLIELAKAAGHQTAYMIGAVWVPKANAPNWIGASDVDEALSAFLLGGFAYPQQVDTTTDSVVVQHIFPIIDSGQGYLAYFPAVKGYTHIAQEDVETLVGYNKAALLLAAGGTTTAHSAVGLDDVALGGHLTGLVSNLVSSLEETYPNAGTEILTGTRMIDPDNGYAFSWGQGSAYYELPDAYRHRLIVNAGSTVITYDQASKGLNKVYFKYSTGNFSRHFEGYPSELFVEPGLTEIEMITQKPYAADGGTFGDVTNTYPIAEGGIYVLAQGYQGSATGNSSDHYSRRLNMMLEDGSFDGEAKLTESLAFAAEVFMQETAALKGMQAGSTGNRSILHGRTGLLGQEGGYYIDIKNQLSASYAGYSGAEDLGIKPYMMLFSGMEHAVLEQTQSLDKQAVSTVRILQLANESNNPVYRLDSSNYSSVVGQLSGYTTAQKNKFQTTVNGGGQVVLPKNADVALNDWTGEGYIENYFISGGEGMFMAIGGGYNGGENSFQGSYDYWTLYTNERARELPNMQTQTFTAADPVDMTSGAYLFDHSDFSMNGPLPLVLSRHYSSHSRLLNGPMGYGWTHSFNIRAQEHSGYEAGLGLRSPEDAASFYVAVTVIRDLVENATTAKEWLAASLAVNWAMEQLTDNAVSIYVGQKVMTFIEQPDGSYTAPPGMTASLAKEGGLYVMQERHGKRYEFDANLNLAEIEGQHGNTLTFAYNTQTNLQTVTSSFGPAFTFGYNTSNLLTSVFDNDGRSISYQYDNDNNLTNFVDAATFSWGVGYDSEHRVKWMKDPEQVTTIQNFYNSIGQVTNQISSSGNPWNFSFTGSENISEDPLGNETTYYLDHKDRTWSIEQPNVARSYSVFDGQNHVVQSIAPNGVTNAVVYDVDHNILSTTNAVGLPEEVVSTFGYDSGHHLRFVTNAVGTAEQIVSETTYTAEHKVDTVTVAKGTALETITDYNYNSDGLSEQVSEGNGARITGYTYDLRGNADTVTSTDAGMVDLNYNLRGELVQQTDAEGNITDYTYGNLGQLLTTTYPNTSVASKAYWKNRLIKTATDPKGNTSTTYWNAAYKQTGIVFPDGSSMTNLYDSADRLIASRNPEGYWTTNTLNEVGQVLTVSTDLSTVSNSYDIIGNLIAFTDAEGRQIQYTYDALNRKVRVDMPEGTFSTFGYNAQGKLVVTTNQPGTALERVASSSYDSLGRVAQTTDALGNNVTFGYNALSRQTLTVDPLGNETRMGYNAQGKPTAITNALDQVAHMTYDLNGNLETVTDPLGRTTQHTYNEMDRLIRTDYPDGSFVTTTFDSNGNMLSQMDAQGTETTFGYNSMNRLTASTSTVDSVSAVTSYTYDNNGTILSQTDAEGNTTSYQYDALGRQVFAASAISQVTNEFDAVGNLTLTEVDPDGLSLWTINGYDSMNRLVSQQTSLASKQFQHDELGRTVNAINALSKEWKTEYDLQNRPVAQVRPSGAREETQFDALGRRTRFINAEGKAINFGFDALGQLTSITNAIGNVTDYGFDATGNIAWRQNGEGELTEYSYDSMSQLVAVTNENVEVATFNHDLNGNIIAYASPLSSCTFGHDEMNRMTASTQSVDSVNFVVQNQFDLNGNRTGITYPGGLSVSYNYGADNRLETVSISAPSAPLREIDFSYDTANRLTGVAYPNGINSTFGHDAESRITSIQHGNFVDRTIERNALGFKETELIDAGIKPTTPETGRRIKTHNDADQLTSEWVQTPTNDFTVSYTYNQNGALTSAGTEDYTYDYNNMLTSVDSASSAVDYLYDASGARIGRISGTTTNYFVVDHADGLKRPLAETDASGSITRYYVWSGIHLLCHIEADGTTRYYHSDELGSTLALTDDSGTVTDEFAYMPYGYANHTGSSETPFQWLGGYGVYYDADTDLHLTLHRAYSSKLKRFISPDPLGIDGGVNVYAMANLNPLYFVDPYGLSGLESSGWDTIASGWDNLFPYSMFNPVTELEGAYNALEGLTESVATVAGAATYDVLDLVGADNFADQYFGYEKNNFNNSVNGTLDFINNAAGTAGYWIDTISGNGGMAEVQFGAQKDAFVDQSSAIMAQYNEPGGGGRLALEFGMAYLGAKTFPQASYLDDFGYLDDLMPEVRMTTAQEFYKSAGWNEQRMASHLDAINFSKPVDVITIPKGTQLSQFGFPNDRVGSYFTYSGSSSSGLGIYPRGRVKTNFKAVDDLQALRSTAADATDFWSVPGLRIEAPGGKIQLFIPKH